MDVNRIFAEGTNYRFGKNLFGFLALRTFLM